MGVIIKKHKTIIDFIENILDCVFFIDTNYLIKHINRETLEFLRYREDQLLGKRFDYVLGESTRSNWDLFRKHFSRWPLKNHEVALKSKDGVEIPTQINITPINNKQIFNGWLVTAKDMSSARELIRELARSRKELQQTVDELEKSRNELIQSEKLSFAGRMATSIAHEIKNPLNIIGMAVQQLHNELRKKDSRREYTKVIIDHIYRVDKLITEFVSIAKPPKLKLHYKDVNAIVEQAVKLLQPKIYNKKAKLHKDLDSELPKIKIDENHILQAFTNILLNACDALPRRSGKIWISSRKEDNSIVITFRNAGKIIHKKDLIRIFDPFFSTKRTGTGLGMSIAYGIIGTHKGTISIESNKKVGTVFTVRLPL